MNKAWLRLELETVLTLCLNIREGDRYATIVNLKPVKLSLEPTDLFECVTARCPQVDVHQCLSGTHGDTS